MAGINRIQEWRLYQKTVLFAGIKLKTDKIKIKLIIFTKYIKSDIIYIILMLNVERG